MALMAKSIRHQMPYDASVEEVASMLDDPAFREEVCRAQRAVRHDVRIDGDDVRIDQWLPTAGVPSFARKIVGEETNLVVTETWTSPTEADLTYEIPGKPGEIHGTLKLTPSGDGAVKTVDLTVKVGVPLVGGKLEDLIADLITKAMQVEHRTGIDYLSR